MKCRHCQTELEHMFCDLGFAPPSNAYIPQDRDNAPETWYPLKVMVCHNCWLVQTQDYAKREDFFSNDYAYFSATSKSWCEHAKRYVDDMAQRFDLNENSLICEIAANDGYLLQYALAANIPCYGVEPTASTAAVARDKGLEIFEEFFGTDYAQKLVSEGKSADLTAANNVLAHVPDINDFVRGFSIVLKKDGVATFEFPHLLNLINKLQFDTIYHEHYSYLSLIAVQRIFAANGLQVFDVQEWPTHGGSLRVLAQRSDTGTRPVTKAVANLIAKERAANLDNLTGYADFQDKAEKVKNELLKFLIKAKEDGKKVAAYGAAAKGNTFMNFAGVRPDLVQFAVDNAVAKQNKRMPGSHIPIVSSAMILSARPDYVLILPWNLKEEISNALAQLYTWGGKCVIAIPEIMIF